jgi:hypothetical protein
VDEIGLRRAAHAERAHEPVALERAPAEDFGQPAGAEAAVDLELPQAILRMREAEREVRVALGAREDMRHAVRVAQDFDRGAHSAERDFAFDAGERLPQIHIAESQSHGGQSQ